MRSIYGTSSTPRDPNATGTGRHGGTGDQHHRGEFATVISFQADTYAATVRTERGRTLNGVPIRRSSPGELITYPAGTEVLVSYEYGPPIIMGVISTPAGRHANTPTYNVTSGINGFGGQGDDKDTLNAAGNFRQAQEPTDLMPGDYGTIGQDGNLIATLEGGVNVIKSSPLSQIRTHKIGDLVEIFSRNYRHVTDMGEFKIQNNDGRINMSFRGASDQRSEAGPDEENWTVRMDLGSEGDMFNFELCTPQGQTMFKLHVDSDGAAELFSINGLSLGSGSRSGGSHNEEHTGDSSRLLSGNRTTNITGDETKNIGGTASTTVDGDNEANVGNDHRVQALRDIAIGAGRNMNVAVQGGEGNDALVFDVEDGHWTVNVGSASAPDSGINFNTFRGDYTFTSQAGGDYVVETRTGNVLTTSTTAKFVTGQPDSVVLGGDSIKSHLVKWEELQKHLQTLYNLFDKHIHRHEGTAVAAGMFPVSGVSGMPLVPMSPSQNPDIINLKSVVAGVSG